MRQLCNAAARRFDLSPSTPPSSLPPDFATLHVHRPPRTSLALFVFSSQSTSRAPTARLATLYHAARYPSTLATHTFPIPILSLSPSPCSLVSRRRAFERSPLPS
ncbi:hypothetical protein A0H81_10411 [Grifola frondosa]|uniref:Uncharacterized protein n=1 Tax=Grifola frondosa TaxID=5627 RepID=A0A1C7LZA2_GRIFR|nr:hypothetical protein A0H81_10411 [Grifola frondosa]